MKKDYKQMNEEYALHNMNCEDEKDYKYVMVNNYRDNWYNKIPLGFYKNGSVIVKGGNIWKHWKEIEEPKKRLMTCKELIDAGTLFIYPETGSRLTIVRIEIEFGLIFYSNCDEIVGDKVEHFIDCTWSDYTGKQRNSFEVEA